MADRVFKLKFLGDISDAGGAIDQLGNKFSGMSTKAKVVTGAVLAGGAAVGAAATGAFMSAISVAADYEKAIVAASVTSGATAEQQQGLWDKGLKVGMQTKFSALESAQAMQILAKNGISATDIMDGALDATTALAASADTGLVVAADTTSKAMGIWGLKTSDMTNVVNRLSGAANASLFTIEDFNLAIAQGGGAAQLAGVSFDDYVTLLALTSKTFASGSDAGTSFKTMFLRLNPQTAKAKKEMAALGLYSAKTGSAFYDSQGKLKDMAGIVGTLNDATKDLTEQERIQAFMTIFGTDAVRAAALSAQFAAADFEDMNTKLGSTDAMAQAKARMDNAKDSMDQLRGAIEVMQISVGAKFLPVVKGVALWLAEYLPKIPTGLLLAVGGFAIFIGMLSAVGLALLPIITLFGPLGLAGAASGLAPIIAAAIPFLAVAAAVTALIAVGYLLFAHWDEIKKKAGEVRDAILGTVGLDQGPAATPAKKGVNALAAGVIQAVPIYGPLTNLIGGTRQILGGGGNTRTQMGALSPEGLATGGLITRTGLAIVDRGERVLTPDQQRGGGNVYNFNFAGSLHTDAGLQELILQAQRTIAQRGGSLA